MLNFQTRSTKLELLDGDVLPLPDLVQNMKELNTINSYLGGHDITRCGFKQFLPANTKLIVLEIGCGGGDNLHAIDQYCKKRNIDVELVGLDMNEHVISYAKQTYSEIQFHCCKYQDFSVEEKPDIIFSSLFCHHFRNPELVEQVQWMWKHSAQGFFINDLHRHMVAYYSIKFITALFSKSYLVKHDAPLSVARGFSKTEWKKILSIAGIQPFQLNWKWAFRHLIVYKHAGK